MRAYEGAGARPSKGDSIAPSGTYELRKFVQQLETAGELERWRDPVSLRDVARMIESSEKAILFERVRGCHLPLLANAMASRRRWALAFDVPEDRLLDELRRRMGRLIPPVRVADGPVREVLLVGDRADLTELPAYLQHEYDGAPYISAALDVSKHPETGRYNIGVRRLMLRGPRETGIDVVSPSDLRAYYRRARELGRRFEIAFVIGAHPLDYLATQMKVETDDEFEIMGGFRGESVPLVRCQTVDLEVPADAEVVLEGYLEGDWTEVEGPFGEYTGCYGAAHFNPVFRLTGIMRRRDAIFETATIGGARLHHTDTAVITALRTELLVWESVSRAVAEPRAVYCPPAATGLHHVRISLRVRDPGDGRNAVIAALGSNAEVKLAIAVDDDIDIYDDKMVEWAIATRYQADTDTVIIGGLRTFPLDPSLPPHEGSKVTTAKLGIDATRRWDKPAHVFAIPRPPFSDAPSRSVNEGQCEDLEDVVQRMAASLVDGPRFVDWLTMFPTLHQADLVRALGVLRQRGLVRMDTEGRYWPVG